MGIKHFAALAALRDKTILVARGRMCSIIMLIPATMDVWMMTKHRSLAESVNGRPCRRHGPPYWGML